MKKKILPVIAALVFILVVILFMILGKVIDKYSPTDERQDLGIHYGITSEEEVAIIYNNELIEAKGKVLNGVVYLRVDTVKNYINDRFYWDANENILRYTTAEDLVSVPAESTTYTITKDSHSLDHIIVKADAETAYVAIDFVKTYSNFAYEIFENPNRVIITTAWGNYTTTTTKKDTELRILGGIKSPILDDLKKGEELTVLKELETWTEVITNDGIIGYVKSKNLGNNSTKTLTSDYVPEEFTHIKKDFEINMAWHQVFNRSANSNISSVLQSTKGLNVISPSWFYLKDNNGNIGSLASTDYVNYCHQHNVEVWALVSNFGAADQGLENPDLTSILTHTSSRDNLVNNLISSAIQYNLDGINIDFESVDPAVGDSYIQFIRELSLKCANNGIVLSVDNYVPRESTAHYNRKEQGIVADYVIIMGYDEHWGGGGVAGSVASLGFVEDGIVRTLEEVPANKIINAVPFYTRVWKTNGDKVTSEALDMETAQSFISRNALEMRWNEEAGQNYGEIQKGNTLYQIWMEDKDSIESKLAVMRKYKIGGVAAWKLGYETPDIWDKIAVYLNS